MEARLKLFLFTFLIAWLLPLSGTAAKANSLAPKVFSNKPDQTNHENILKFLKSDALKVSKAEIKLANNLAKVFEITEKGYINIGLTKKVLKQSRNYSVFNVYKDWLRSIIDIYSSKTASSLRINCSRLAEEEPKNHLKAQLLKKSALMCFNQYLKVVAKKPLNIKAHDKDLPFFKRTIHHISAPANLESLSFFLGGLKENNQIWKSYSNILADYFVNSGKAPPKQLLQFMDITPKLTQYIQAKGMDDNSAKWIFYSELKKLIKKAYKAADKGMEEKEVKKLLNEALSYYTISYQHLPKAKSDLGVLSLGKSLTRRSYYDSARTAFRGIANLNPKDENAVFEIMWTWLTQKNYKKAYSEVVKKRSLDKRYKSLKDERLQFWTAYTLKKLGHESNKEIFENLIGKSALNYYSILASKLLSKHYEAPSQKIYYQIANANSVTPKTMPKLDAHSRHSLKRLKIWGGLDFKPFIRMEYRNMFDAHSRVIASKNDSHDLSQSQSSLILLCASALKKEENYLESFKVIYRGLNNNLISLDETTLSILFPKPYLKQVSSQGHNFDPLVALSLIRQESAFNRKARSWVGARGLMQLMPATARIYWRGVKTDHLYNSKLNIKIGSKYLSMLLEKYDNNLVFALSAYNAGESRVKKWRKEYLSSEHSILHNIENIPFPETRKYVKLIYRNLFFYKMMDQKLELADSKNVNEIFDVRLGFNEMK